MKRRFTTALFVFAFCLSLVGCSAVNHKDLMEDDSPGASYGSGKNDTKMLPVLEDARKLIKTVDLTIETRIYDVFLEEVYADIQKQNGYMQSSSENRDFDGTRYSFLVARIPADRLESFLTSLSSNGTITERSEKVEDVTMEYIDAESHLNALRAEQSSLISLLEKAENLSDILLLQERLTKVRGEVESYEEQLRTLQTLIDYSTVNITLYEVDREPNMEQVGFWKAIGVSFSNGFYDMTQFMKSISVFLVGLLPFIMVLAIPVILILVIVGIAAHRRKKSAKKDGRTHD